MEKNHPQCISMGEAAGQLFGMLSAVPFIAPLPIPRLPSLLPSGQITLIDELLFKGLERFPFLPCFILSRHREYATHPILPINTDATGQKKRNSPRGTNVQNLMLSQKGNTDLCYGDTAGRNGLQSFFPLFRTSWFTIGIISKFAISNKIIQEK